MKKALAVLALTVIPLSADAANIQFSGRNAFGSIAGIGTLPSGGTVTATVTAFRSASKSPGGPSDQSGADVQIDALTPDGNCFFGYGSATDIQFTSTPNGSQTKTVNASGTVPVYMYNCSTGDYYVETVDFVMDLDATREVLNKSFGTWHNLFGDGTRYRSRDDRESRGASYAGSTVSSPSIGGFQVIGATVGLAKTHSVEVSK